MSTSIYIGLLNNAALLLAFGLLYDLIFSDQSERRESITRQLVVGFVLGGIGIAVMLNYWEFEPGVFFDTRSILLSISGLFFGPITALMAVLTTAAFRMYQGGAGVWMGILVICTSGIIGIVWKRFTRTKLETISWRELYLFGFVVHLNMLLSMLALPDAITFAVFQKISLPIIIIYPIGTVLLGKLMVSRLAKRQIRLTLRNSEERFRTAFESANDCIMIWDQDYNYLYANQAAIDYVGASRDKVIGKNIRDGFGHVPDFMRLWMSRIDQVFETAKGFNVQDETIIQGSLLFTDSVLTPIYDAGGGVAAVCAVCRDITEQRKMKAELEEAIYRKIEVVKAAKIGLWDWDLKTNRVQYSDEWKRQIGYDPDEIGEEVEEWKQRIHPEDFVRTVEAVERCIDEKGQALQIEFRFRHKDGSYRWILAQASVTTDAEGNSAYLRGSHNDITAYKQSEEARIISEKKFSMAFQHAPLLMSISTIEDGRYLDVNEAFLETTGFTRAEVVGKRSVDIGFISVEDRARLVESIKSEGVVRDFELDLRRVDGSKFHSSYYGELIDVAGKKQLLSIVLDLTAHKRAEEELKESASKLRDAQDMARLGNWLWDVKTGEVTWSKHVYSLFQVDPETFVPTIDSVMSFSPWPEENQRHTELIEQAMASKERGQYEQKIMKADGSIGYYASTFQGVYDDDGELVLIKGTVQDITERKLAEEKRRAMLDEQKAIFESSMVGIMVLYDRTITKVNPRMAEMLGFTTAELEGKGPEQVHLSHENFVEFGEKYYWRLGEMNILQIEYPLRHKDGHTVWCQFSGRAISPPDLSLGAVWIIDDITERKQTEEALQRSEEKFRALFEKSPMGIAYHRLVYDDTGRAINYTFEDANENYRNLLGYDPKGKRVTEVYPGLETDSFDWVGTYARVGQQGETIRFQHYLKLRERWFDIAAFQSSPDHFVVAFFDITDQKSAEIEKSRLESQLHQAQRMESVGRLAGGVAHDFNNLLTSITGNVSLALFDLRPGDPLIETFNEINQAADSAASLTRQLLAFSRKQIINPKVLDLNELINHTHKMLRRIIGEDVELSIRLERNICPVKADPGQVEQILINLAVNARDAMPDGGKLTIETGEFHLTDEASRNHPDAQAGEYVRLAVTDNGQGMDEETRLKIFDPFFTTKKEGEGTGLGLAMVYGIVKQHNGYVEVYSEPDEGTVFKVYLPRAQGKADSLARRSKWEDLPKGHETILVVEDEDMVRNIAVRILTRQGYAVHQADTGGNALALVDKQHRPIDMLLTDIVMPNMNGRELSEKLVARMPNLKVLFTSGYTEAVIEHHGVLDEGLNFIGKPYTPQALAKKVREVLDA